MPTLDVNIRIDNIKHDYLVRSFEWTATL